MSTKASNRRKRTAGRKEFEAMTVGGRIHWLLGFRRLTQSEVAKQAGISQSAISNIIRIPSRHPNAYTLLALSTVLDCMPSFILSGSPKPNPHDASKEFECAELFALFNQLNSLERTQLIVMARILAKEQPDQKYRVPT